MSRHVAQSAVAAQLGIWDAKRLSPEPAASDADARVALTLLRQRHLSMFSEPAYRLIETGWTAPEHRPTLTDGTHVHGVREFTDPDSNRRVLDVEGWVPRIEGRPRDPALPIVDASGRLRGLAKMSFIGPNKASLRFDIAQKRGFDGYVLDPIVGEKLEALVLDDANTVLAAIPFEVNAAPRE